MKKKTQDGDKCEHQIVVLSTTTKPHIWGCVKCLKYSPNPHPVLSSEEVHILLAYAGGISEAKADAKLL